MRGKSVLSDENDPKCYICGSRNVVVHHCLPGYGRRDISDWTGCWCYLCNAHHNMSNNSVHMNKQMDLWLRRRCQAAWEKKQGINDPEHAEFIRLFGVNYL